MKGNKVYGGGGNKVVARVYGGGRSKVAARVYGGGGSKVAARFMSVVERRWRVGDLRAAK